jgi:hypothetical protein
MKKWITRIIRSKTMWLNALGAGAVALEASFSLLQPYVPGNAYAWISISLAVGNAIMRTITTQPLKDK